MKEEVLKYLGYKEQIITKEMDIMIDDVIEEVKRISSFSYVYQERKEVFPFLNHPAYKELLKGCYSYLLIATTLGYNVDKVIKHYQVSDPARALIMDAASSAYVIYMADEYEKKFEERTFRFCPGYEGTSLDDNSFILSLLDKQKPGISVLDSKMLVPSKSMVGIIGLGFRKEKTCTNCVVKNCKYKEEGTLCYQK